MATMISDINIINKTSLSLSNSKLEENVEMKFEVTVRIVGFHLKSLCCTYQITNSQIFEKNEFIWKISPQRLAIFN